MSIVMTSDLAHKFKKKFLNSINRQQIDLTNGKIDNSIDLMD